MIPEIPADVREWLRQVFRGCNAHISGRLQALPTTHEPALDLAFIEHLSRYHSRFSFGSGWAVTITAEYEGGRRHYRRWEVADIGLIFIFRSPGSTPTRKIALLQSKRLYPGEAEMEFIDDEWRREMWAGIERPTRLDDLTVPRTFCVSGESRYEALRLGDEQSEAIAAHEKDTTVPVYYQLYNPATLPTEVRIPRPPEQAPMEFTDPSVGVRIVPYRVLTAALAAEAKGYRPSYNDLVTKLPEPFQAEEAIAGWPLESFVVDEALRCREGYREKGPGDYNMARVVSLRNAPISSAVAVTFDLP